MAAASATATDLSGGFVWVAAERLRALEALEAEIPAIIAKAKEEANAERFAALRARDKEDPAAHVKRTMDWYEKNRDEINAKRREKYKAKKEAEKAAGSATPKTPGP